MPLITIQTNAAITATEEEKLLSKATTITANHLGKPESVTMAIAKSGVAMSFGGTTEPTALFEVEGIELSSEPAGELCGELCDLSEKLLAVPADRVFVKLTNTPRGMWGGNRKVY